MNKNDRKKNPILDEWMRPSKITQFAKFGLEEMVNEAVKYSLPLSAGLQDFWVSHLAYAISSKYNMKPLTWEAASETFRITLFSDILHVLQNTMQ